jgi:hypothetical protein
LAPRDGFEPPTNGLTVRRSTTELPGNSFYFPRGNLEARDCPERPLGCQGWQFTDSFQVPRCAVGIQRAVNALDIRSSAASNVDMLHANDNRMWPGAPKDEPGTTATPTESSKRSANA